MSEKRERDVGGQTSSDHSKIDTIHTLIIDTTDKTRIKIICDF